MFTNSPIHSGLLGWFREKNQTIKVFVHGNFSHIPNMTVEHGLVLTPTCDLTGSLAEDVTLRARRGHGISAKWRKKNTWHDFTCLFLILHLKSVGVSFWFVETKIRWNMPARFWRTKRPSIGDFLNQLKSIHLRLSSNKPSVMQVISVRSTWISDGGILLKLMIFFTQKRHWLSFWFCSFDETFVQLWCFWLSTVVRCLGPHSLESSSLKDSWESPLELPLQAFFCFASARWSLEFNKRSTDWQMKFSKYKPSVIFEMPWWFLKRPWDLIPSSTSSQKQRWYQILSHCKAGVHLFLKPGSFIEKMRVAIKSIHRVTRRFNKWSLHTNVRNAFLIRMLGLLFIYIYIYYI